MVRFLLLLHLLGLALGMGGLLCQLLLLGKYRRSADLKERIGSERMSSSLISLVQKPGLYLSILSGIGLAWMANWVPLSQNWLQLKLLLIFWIILATILMSRNTKNFRTLRNQCGDEDSERLLSLKDNHQMIGYLTILIFFFVVICSLWRPF